MRAAVVGAGVVGLLTALELAERGVEVIVLEAAAVASGASGGPGQRGVRANGRHPAELPLMARAYELWPRLADRVGAPTGYERTGQLHVTERFGDLPALAEQAARQHLAGVPSEVLDASAVREFEPNINEAVVGAVWCPNDGAVDHTATCVAVANALDRRGVSVEEGVRVEDVRALGADKVVVAANGAAPALVAPLGLRVPTFDVYPQVVVIDPRGPGVVRHLVGHAHRRVIVKSLPNGQVMITGGWLGDNGAIVEEHVRGNVEEAVALYPTLAGARLLSAVADRAEAVTADMLPVIDRTEDGAVAVATGWSGHGFAIAPAVAEHLAEWATTGDWPDALAPFSAGRFSSS